MLLTQWEKLPTELKTEETKAYYDYLKSRIISLMIKRLFDIVISLGLMVLLSPVFLIIAFCIKLDSKGTIFYCQERVTFNNKNFKIFKFRTMISNADTVGSLVTVGNDSRITRVGSKIRKCRLDEIPQLINIFLGQMSLVGTRPEVRRYVDVYTPEMMATLLLPAGVTSLASIRYKSEDEILDKYTEKGLSVDEAYVNYVLPDKMKYNLEYMKSFSFIGDIKLMIQTLLSVIF